jgi:hypothetical protein
MMHHKVVGAFLRYLCAYNGYERRTGRGLFLLCTQKVTFFPGEIVFSCVLCAVLK